MYSCNFGKKKFSFQYKNDSADTTISKAVLLWIEQLFWLLTRKPLATRNKPSKCFCYQTVIKRQKETPETRLNCGFPGLRHLLPLDGGGGFTGDVVNNPVDALDLIDNAGRDPI